MKYQTYVDYYKAARQQSHAQSATTGGAQRGGKSIVASNTNAAAALIVPHNQRDIILGADEALANTNLSNLNANKQFKSAFVALSIILNNVYRNALKAQRKKSINALRKDATSSTTEEVTSTSVTSPTKLPKITREQCIPEAFLTCRSNASKAAVALYCMNGIRGVTRRNILYHALDGQIVSVPKTIKLIGQIKQDANVLKEMTFDHNPDKAIYPILVQTLLELAELTRDKSPAKLAVVISEPVYLLAVQHLLRHNLFDSIYPYEPLIARYLHDCVAPINVAREQIMIGNQFKLDPGRTMSYLLDAIPKTSYKHAHASSHVKFDNDQTYEVFIGQINYIHNVMVTYVQHEGRNYRTITYNDCLYDVVGYSVERTENGATMRDSVLFDNMRWSERLALLPYRAKIKLERMTGEQLNAFRGTASLKISWMENNHECSKIVTIKNESNTAIKKDRDNNEENNNNNIVGEEDIDNEENFDVSD